MIHQTGGTGNSKETKRQQTHALPHILSSHGLRSFPSTKKTRPLALTCCVLKSSPRKAGPAVDVISCGSESEHQHAADCFRDGGSLTELARVARERSRWRCRRSVTFWVSPRSPLYSCCFLFFFFTSVALSVVLACFVE